MALTLRAALLLLASAAALASAALAQPEKPASKQSELAARALARWLESDDFDSYHLELLTKHGALVVPSLVAALEAGPSPAKRELVRRSLDAEYEALAERARSDPSRRLRSKAAFLDHYLANFEALYRIRAAQALSAIGGPSAKKALEGAVQKSPREDVRTAVRQALKEIK